MSTLSTLWTIIRCCPTVLYYLPTVISLITKIRELLGSEEIQTVFREISSLLGKVAPPAPTTDSTGTKPADIEEEKRQRRFRFRNRMQVARTMTDQEAHEFCSINNVPSYGLA